MLRLIAFGILAMVQPVHAQTDPLVPIYQNGEDLARYCRAYLHRLSPGSYANGKEAANGSLCIGFVAGFVDTYNIQGGLPVSLQDDADPFCAPMVKIDTLVEVVARYIDAHPELWHGTGYGLTLHALSGAYPCPLGGK